MDSIISSHTHSSLLTPTRRSPDTTSIAKHNSPFHFKHSSSTSLHSTHKFHPAKHVVHELVPPYSCGDHDFSRIERNHVYFCASMFKSPLTCTAVDEAVSGSAVWEAIADNEVRRPHRESVMKKTLEGEFISSSMWEPNLETADATFPQYVNANANCRPDDVNIEAQPDGVDPVTSAGGPRLDFLYRVSSSEDGGGNAHGRRIPQPNNEIKKTAQMLERSVVEMFKRQGVSSDSFSARPHDIEAVLQRWEKDANSENGERQENEQVQPGQKTEGFGEKVEDSGASEHSDGALFFAGGQDLNKNLGECNSAVFVDDEAQRVLDDEVQRVLDAYRLKYGNISEEMYSSIVLNLSRCGKVMLGWKILDHIKNIENQLSIQAYNALLAATVRAGLCKESLQLFERIKKSVEPNNYTYELVLSASAQLKGWEVSLSMFNEMVSEAHQKPDVHLYNAIISICGRARQWHAVLSLWEMMKVDGCRESERTFKLLLGTFVQTNRCELALEVYYTMIQTGLKPAGDLIKGLACVCAKRGRWALALEFFFDMLESNIEPNDVVCNALIDALGKAGELRLALGMYEWMRTNQKISVYTLSALLNGLNKAGLHEKALELFQSSTSYLSPNVHVYNSVLVACQKLGAWEKALQLVWEMERRGPKPDTISYTLMISSCKADKQVKIAVEVYERMLQMGCIPNTYTYSALIRICGKKYFWQQAEWFLEEMLHRGIAPNTHVYFAIIYVFKKSGQSHRAKRYYTEMFRKGLLSSSQYRQLNSKS